MTRVKHTPGPWHQIGFWVEHEDDDVADICLCDPEDLGQGHLKRSADEIIANARLIAAAPDLYAALRAMLKVCYDVELNDKTIAAVAAARSALAKAEGRS